MKINKSQHKKFLYTLFFLKVNGQVDLSKQKNFPLDILIEASTAFKKLKEDAKASKSALKWEDGDIEFTKEESEVLKSLVESVKEATVSDAETIQELKKILK